LIEELHNLKIILLLTFFAGTLAVTGEQEPLRAREVTAPAPMQMTAYIGITLKENSPTAFAGERPAVLLFDLESRVTVDTLLDVGNLFLTVDKDSQRLYSYNQYRNTLDISNLVSCTKITSLHLDGIVFGGRPLDISFDTFNLRAYILNSGQLYEIDLVSGAADTLSSEETYYMAHRSGLDTLVCYSYSGLYMVDLKTNSWTLCKKDIGLLDVGAMHLSPYGRLLMAGFYNLDMSETPPKGKAALAFLLPGNPRESIIAMKAGWPSFSFGLHKYQFSAEQEFLAMSHSFNRTFIWYFNRTTARYQEYTDSRRIFSYYDKEHKLKLILTPFDGTAIQIKDCATGSDVLPPMNPLTGEQVGNQSLAVTLVITEIAVDACSPLTGDLNGDGLLDMADVSGMINRLMSGIPAGNRIEDINRDMRLDIFDLLLLLKDIH